MKIQCPNIKKGENVHEHYCYCCKGKQHIPFIDALKYQLYGLLVLDDNGKDASDEVMHDRILSYINYYKSEHKYTGPINFKRIYQGEPIPTLNACIETLYAR